MFGVSFISAYYLNENFRNTKLDSKNNPIWKIPSFYETHLSEAKPFHEILSSYQSGAAFNEFLKKTYNSNRNITIKEYTKEEIFGDKMWLQFIEPGSIGKINSFENPFFSRKDSSSEKGFNPKFRVVVSLENFENGLSYIH